MSLSLDNYPKESYWVKKYNQSVPRYTSYPTVPVWPFIDSKTKSLYKESLMALSKNKKWISLYIHLPFCERRCYFCACNVIIDKNRLYVEKYLSFLKKEIESSLRYLTRENIVLQMHWGGGTPNYLTLSEIADLYEFLQNSFVFDKNAELSIEIDVRYSSTEEIAFLKKLGFTRLSFGVQDLNTKVQESINRVQSFDQIKELLEFSEKVNFKNTNIDLIYGLPHQNLKNFDTNVKKIIQLNPSRIALYSYAHVPWVQKHQKKIPDGFLPSSLEKFLLFSKAEELFKKNNYFKIGFDHFAKKDDELVKAFFEKKLYRNFMGYSIQRTKDLLAFGLSSISYIEGSYFQNTKILREYYEFLDQNENPKLKVYRLLERDHLKKWIIDQLTSYFELDFEDLKKKWNLDFETELTEEKKKLETFIDDGFIVLNSKKLKVTEQGTRFIRNICMVFDDYLPEKGKEIFSKAV